MVCDLENESWVWRKKFKLHISQPRSFIDKPVPGYLRSAYFTGLLIGSKFQLSVS